MDLTTILVDLADDAVDVVTVPMKTVVAKLEMRDQEDDQTGGEADGKAQDIDQRMDPVLPQLTDRDEPVVSQHVRSF